MDWQSTCGLVAMTSALHAEGRQLEPGQVYAFNQKLATTSFLEKMNLETDANISVAQYS